MNTLRTSVKSSRWSLQSNAFWVIVLVAIILQVVQAGLFEATDGSDEDDAKLPYYLQPFMFMGIKCYPASIALYAVMLAGLSIALGTRKNVSYATVAHILIRNDSKETYNKLVALKKEIMNEGPDELGRKFATAAATYSQCPSKSRFGSLGTFSPNTTMARAFDEAVFNPDQDEDEVVGPIKTNAGWHLILIQERHLQETKTKTV